MPELAPTSSDVSASTEVPIPGEVAAGARRGAYVTMALAVAVGSFSFTLIKLVLRDISPLSLAAGRVVFSAIAFVTIVTVQPRRRLRIEHGDRLRVIFCGLGGSAGFHVLYSWGQSRVSVAVAAVVLATMPAMVALGEMVFLSHRLGPRQYVGLLLSVLGVVVISTSSGSGNSTVLGVLAVGAATLVWSAVTVTTRSLADRYDPWWVNTPGTVIGAIVMLAVAAPNAPEFGDLGPATWVYLVWLGMIGSAFIYAALAHSMKSLSATVTSSLSTLVTPLSVVVAWVGLGETPGPAIILGGLIAVVGVGAVTHGA